MKSIIEVKNLTKDYGSGRGVFDISFEIKRGETFGFLGPNGAGKTTAIRHLMGFSRPQKGKTSIFNRDTFKHYQEILKHVGYIPGELAFPAGLTGYELIKMMQNLMNKHNKKRLEELCILFKLESSDLSMNTKQMSLGTKRKLAIVTAFMSDPEVLILDEPTSGLDPIMQQIFIEFVKNEKKQGKTIFLSSHLFNEVDQTCDRICIIKDGRIVDNFNANDLKHDNHKFYEIIFTDSSNYKEFIKQAKDINYFNILESNEGKFKVLIETHDNDINKVVECLSGYDIHSFTNIKESLQDYFLKFYQNDKVFGGLD